MTVKKTEDSIMKDAEFMFLENERETKEGKRRFNNPAIYWLTWKWQGLLWWIGVAWHNSYSNECTKDFNCCNDIGRKKWLVFKQKDQ